MKLWKSKGGKAEQSKKPGKSEKKVSISTISIIVFIIVILISISAFAYIGSVDKSSQLSAYSDSWNDISNFRSDLLDQRTFEGKSKYSTSSIVSSPTMLNKIDDPENKLLIVMGVEKKYSSEEAEAINDFVLNGGKLIMADDFGYANSLAYNYFDVFFYGARLWDEQYEKNPRFVKISVDLEDRTIPHKYFSGVIMLNEPSAIETTVGKNTELAHSSPNSWVDLDNNGERGYADTNEDGIPDTLEVTQEHAIIIERRIGELDGRAIFVSDPGIFINNMWSKANNSAFAIALVEYLLPHGEIIFEESRHIQNSPIDNAQLALYEGLVVLTTDDQLTLVTITLALLGLGVLIIVMENPSELRHRFDLGHISLKNLYKTSVTHEDCDRIRYLFLERVRIAYGLTVEDFKELSVDELTDMIMDPDLIDFALDWDKMLYGQDLEKILLKIRRWG
jgi:hypothetical protein